MKPIQQILLSIFILICFWISANAQNNPPVAVDDTASAYSGREEYYLASYLLANDSDPNGDGLSLDGIVYTTGKGTAIESFGFKIEYRPDSFFVGIDTIAYVICDDGTPSLCDTGLLIITIKHKAFEAFEHLDINNIRARFYAGGSDFWDRGTGIPDFEVPKGSGKHTMFTSDLWRRIRR